MRPYTPQEDQEDTDMPPEERRKFLEAHGADFVDVSQLQALGEHLERERKRKQELLKDKRD